MTTLAPTCLYCQKRMRSEAMRGWRPVSVQGRIAGWTCPTCIKAKDGGGND